MATLSIVTYPAKILKRRASQIVASAEIKKLSAQMTKTMYENQGIGLAAPQIGISKRIIVVETSTHPRETSEKNPGKPLAFLNPVIIKKSGKLITEEEGCLSLPGVFVKVRRSATVELISQTPEGREVKIKAGGLTARIFQHEIDHLNGKLIIDRISLWKRFSIKRSLKSKGKISSRKN